MSEIDRKIFSVSFDVEVPIYEEADEDMVDEDMIENIVTDSLQSIGCPFENLGCDLGYMEVVAQEE